MYRVVAGLEIDDKAPGYKHILIEPHPGGGLTFAKASIDTIYGRVESGWKLNEAGKELAVNVEVPPNTTATVRLPNAKLDDVTEGGKPLAGRSVFSNARQAGNAVAIDVGSGSYEFKSNYVPAAK